METGIALLRTFGVLMISLAMGMSLFVNHVGRAAALSAARSGAIAAADTLDADSDCTLADADSAAPDSAAADSADTSQSQRARQRAAEAVVSRLKQLAAVTPTELSVAIDPACVVVVGVKVAVSSWLPLPQPTAVVCLPRPVAAAAAVEALVTC